ncbi:MAG TPA: enoyl-CoA hydratase-related protein [Syntrophomonadaceae bacterium]|nr:enoyl-CoA hydratase/isomerase family protein [Syntrophomonadaceae bacterium]HOQ09370.1 enoyl-CoA hydratase-related protein [Syntrophomonadaceae bacterium]HPU48240.1 enoyl-CoA hydratase-related protein [Syntrophomonadaceae bacterium]
MAYDCISLTRHEMIGIVTLQRPQALNALNHQMIEELEQVFMELETDEKVKAVIITGEKHFAAGADINDMLDFNPEQARAFSFRHCFARIEAFPKPVLAAISGFALGGGLELALVCDWRIADNTARLGLPEINLGIFPGAGGTLRLPRLIGAARAKEMIFSGKPINAQQALEYGLINQLADDALAEAIQTAEMLASKPPVALKLAKQCINQAFDMDGVKAIEFESVAWASCFATRDQREGMKAFIEKRKPEFTGT